MQLLWLDYYNIIIQNIFSLAKNLNANPRTCVNFYYQNIVILTDL